jgi:hypothetical protein
MTVHPAYQTYKDNKFVQIIKDGSIMMDKLLASDALDIENLKNHYSPKFAQIVKDVEESPGSVLIYSHCGIIYSSSKSINLSSKKWRL